MSNNDRTSRGGTRLLHCGIPVPSMTAMGQKQTSRRHLANLRFASQSGHARVASRSPAQKLYILHKKLSLSGALCAKPVRGGGEQFERAAALGIALARGHYFLPRFSRLKKGTKGLR